MAGFLDDDLEDDDGAIYMLRCPRHNECFVCDSVQSMEAPLEKFLERHMGCGKIESFENGELMGFFTAPGLPN